MSKTLELSPMKGIPQYLSPLQFRSPFTCTICFGWQYKASSKNENIYSTKKEKKKNIKHSGLSRFIWSMRRHLASSATMQVPYLRSLLYYRVVANVILGAGFLTPYLLRTTSAAYHNHCLCFPFFPCFVGHPHLGLAISNPT